MTAATPTQTPRSGGSLGHPRHHAEFATTHWSVVLAAGRSDTAGARKALARLCQTYWYPLYAYVRRRGHSPHDAEDLTQGYFARLLELNSVAGLAPAKGRFRAFLLAAMKHYLADARDHAQAQKRDIRKVIALDSASAENLYQHEPADHATPETIFERRWALTLLATVAEQLREEYAREDRAELFQQLSFSLAGDRSSVPYAELAPRVKLSEGALRVAVHRLRQRYRQLLQNEIAHTVAEPCEIKEELQYLLRVVAG